MNHVGTQTLEKERFNLRKFTIDDAESMYQNWARDERVTHFLTWPAHSSAQVTASLLETWVSEYEESDTYNWCIEWKEIRELIGSIIVVSINAPIESVEIGYCLSKEYWNKGIMTNTVQTIMGFLFSTVGVNLIEANVASYNQAACVVLVKAGFNYTGMRRQSAMNNNGICNVMTYEILKQDYIK